MARPSGQRVAPGDTIGRWTVTGLEEGRGSWARCRCRCGREKRVFVSSLVSGDSRSCGCLKRETAGRQSLTHGQSHTPEYNTWVLMRRRCSAPADPAYADYGGRGIHVCSRWDQSFPAFLQDMGERPSPGHTLDRLDNGGPYEPGNCRWATRTEQSRNRRSNRLITLEGETHCLKEWAQRKNLRRTTVERRITVMGWDPERALNTPVR